MYMYALTCTCAVYLVGGGLIIEANIPVQQLEGQRGEGAYFREDAVHTCTYYIHSTYNASCQLVSSPDPTPKRRKGSGTHQALFGAHRMHHVM